MAQYEYLDHTADVAIHAWGESLPAVLAAMTEGVLDCIYEGTQVSMCEERRVSVRGDASDECIVNYFNELLFQIEAERWLPRGVRDVVVTANRIKALLVGEPFDPQRHVLSGEIKAATYHQFQLRRKEGGWDLQMVFDV